jgi:predicted transcriptional regulator
MTQHSRKELFSYKANLVSYVVSRHIVRKNALYKMCQKTETELKVIQNVNFFFWEKNKIKENVN